MDDTIASLLIDNGCDVGRAVNAFYDADVLLTVPHAFSFAPVRHDADFAALEAAQILKNVLGERALLHVGHLDRHQQADLNRAPDASAPADAERRDWQMLVQWWVATHPDGTLIDVHSFPKRFDWQNNTTTLKKPTEAKGPLVVLLPPNNNSAFGRKFASGLTGDIYQGTEVNAIITMGGRRTVLLEFEEGDGLETIATNVAYHLGYALRFE